MTRITYAHLLSIKWTAICFYPIFLPWMVDIDLTGQHQILWVVFGILALGTTLLRLFLRRRRFWWDDACALFSMIFLVVLSVCSTIDVQHPDGVSQPTRIVLYYLTASFFYSVVWLARLSILFSIIRVDPNKMQRKRLLFVAAAFLVTGILLICQVFWICSPEDSWKQASFPQCHLSIQAVVFQMISSIVADFILIAVPIKICQDLLDKGLRRRLMLIFSASIGTTVVSLVHSIYIAKKGGLRSAIAGSVEAGVSLIVCNVPVFAIACIRLRGTSKSHEGLGTTRISTEIPASVTVITMSDRITED